MNDSSNNIIAQVYDSFGVLPPEQRRAQAVEPTKDNAGNAPTPEFVDLYQKGAAESLEEARKVRPRGSSSRVLAVAGDIVESLAEAHKRAEQNVKMLKDSGAKNRAEIVKRQYMEERFIPAVEAVIRFTSPDELLNCKKALSELDKLVLGTGSASGYTASYVRSAYDNLLGQDLDGRFMNSDPVVKDAIRRIKVLSFNDNIRAAVGAAAQIKKKIDDGEQRANAEDYELIERVANF